MLGVDLPHEIVDQPVKLAGVQVGLEDGGARRMPDEIPDAEDNRDAHDVPEDGQASAVLALLGDLLSSEVLALKKLSALLGSTSAHSCSA